MPAPSVVNEALFKFDLQSDLQTAPVSGAAQRYPQHHDPDTFKVLGGSWTPKSCDSPVAIQTLEIISSSIE